MMRISEPLLLLMMMMMMMMGLIREVNAREKQKPMLTGAAADLSLQLRKGRHNMNTPISTTCCSCWWSWW
uniref:Putative secreted protein n=1 Tax=Anopheles marajoara TaxID=58244 RepID=A0A2M4CF24_9DIPT